MKLTPIAANQTEVSYNDGTQVFFSYQTPVAAYLPERGYVRTAKFWSKTTSRHINKWLPSNIEHNEVDQGLLDNLTAN